MFICYKKTGAAEAFAKVVTKKINTARKAQIVTWFSAFLFSYTEPCLILGTIMRPVTDAVRVSRAKLAYILDSMGCNLASFSPPISSYGPFITGLIATQLAAASISANEWGSIYKDVSIQFIWNFCYANCFNSYNCWIGFWTYV